MPPTHAAQAEVAGGLCQGLPQGAAGGVGGVVGARGGRGGPRGGLGAQQHSWLSVGVRREPLVRRQLAGVQGDALWRQRGWGGQPWTPQGGGLPQPPQHQQREPSLRPPNTAMAAPGPRVGRGPL